MDQLGLLRTEWLLQIAEAIESAQKLAWQLRTKEGASAEARQLYNRLETARSELEILSGIAGSKAASDVDWLRALGWSGGPPADDS